VLNTLILPYNDLLSYSFSHIVNTLFLALDSVKYNKGGYIIGATNQPELVNLGIFALGRLNTNFFIDLPDISHKLNN